VGAAIAVFVIGWGAVETYYVLDHALPKRAESLSDRNWIDRAVPSDAKVGIVPSPNLGGLDPVPNWWLPEFWNKTVAYSYSIAGSNPYTPFPENTLELHPQSGVVTSDKQASYLVMSSDDVRMRPLLRAPVTASASAGTATMELLAPRLPYKADWMTLGLTLDSWTQVGKRTAVRLFSDGPAARGRLVRITLELPSGVRARARYALGTGRRSHRGSLEPGRQASFAIPVCTPAGRGFTDIPLRSSATTKLQDGTRAGLRVAHLTITPDTGACPS
jgi:hypothetical protein